MPLNEESRGLLEEEFSANQKLRKTRVLGVLGIATSSWYRKPTPPGERRRPGPAPTPIPDEVLLAVVKMAVDNPWYGYKRIAAMCRRAGTSVKDRQAYQVMRDHGLLQKRRPCEPELYQSAKLFELLPQAPNDLWQMDVTYIHIPGYGWRYAVTVIDYYSRYLLACHLTSSYSAAEVSHALRLAREEAERIHGRLKKPPFLVTDNGPSFVARRFTKFVADDYSHVRIRYRTPTQLGLLERFHRTLKIEEVHWRLYDNPQHAKACLEEFRTRYNERRPHWALVPVQGGDPLVPREVYAEGRPVRIPKWQSWARKAKEKLDQLMQTAA
jgi:transposase InsO family protein